MKPLIAAALLILAAAPALAADGSLSVSHAWTRPAAQGGISAGYVTIANTGANPDVLLAVETPMGKASLHRSSVQSGIMSMREMSSGIDVPAHQTVKLAPGGDHIMLAGLNRPLLRGQKFPATLVFRKAGRMKTEISVETSPPDRLESRKQ